MKVGHVIRAERVRQNMKQIVLAKGICTPSYLSKIERNMINPSEEVVELLMERLGMDSTKFRSSVESDFEQKFAKLLKDTYRSVITKRDKTYTREQLDLLVNENPVFYDQSLYYTYLLIVFRFRLILGQNIEQRWSDLEVIDEFTSNFDDHQMYLYTLNKALLYYSSGKMREAIENFEHVVEMINLIHLEEWEKAELDYILGVAYTADIRLFHSIEYIRKALTYFREQFSMKRVLECYILLGITYKKSEQYQEAFEAYTKAQQICEDFNLEDEMGLIYHNLGSLNSILGNREEAIDYYLKSINSQEYTKNPYITIYCLIIEYSKIAQKNKVITWVKKGIQLYEEQPDSRFITYYYHFRFYQFIYIEKFMDEKRAIEVIEYFKKLSDYRYVQKYYTALAEWYYDNRKYKLAANYYREANRYSYINKKIESWEDLG
ncbi:helix-turn-helix domain-containing protein [Sporosarcina sp. OR05]|uniref:helix-turn-helix domain-containing protein n=1 Tax=Sporosarcina sp. OR05 TaxID=2969819 RepID=UPI00352B5AA5